MIWHHVVWPRWLLEISCAARLAAHWRKGVRGEAIWYDLARAARAARVAMVWWRISAGMALRISTRWWASCTAVVRRLVMRRRRVAAATTKVIFRTFTAHGLHRWLRCWSLVMRYEPLCLARQSVLT